MTINEHNEAIRKSLYAYGLAFQFQQQAKLFPDSMFGLYVWYATEKKLEEARYWRRIAEEPLPLATR